MGKRAATNKLEPSVGGLCFIRQANPQALDPVLASEGRMLSDPMPSGAVPWAWLGRAGLPGRLASFWLPDTTLVPDSFTHCTTRHPIVAALVSVIGWPTCRVSRRGGALYGHAGHLLLSYRRVSEIFVHSPSNTAELPKTFCLACTPNFKAGVALGGLSSQV
eukprot:1141330-Pelagomonas_calceolata.AAC.4